MPGRGKNCKITVEMCESGKIRQYCYIFDDYRVAQATANILCNLKYMDYKSNILDTDQKGFDMIKEGV